ncbi:MAG TPA: NAD-dependent epimerase/dehydratase family protein [Steroidobacter sp.]|uniref:NAD-dependent epimerase/dehydratase family protein n=1 Tax=Steroidobacter sp. TaxID=1978227 RepID=UPI002EDA98C8
MLVTGATGYIGCHVVSALQECGHRVIAAVRTRDSARRLTDEGVAVEVTLADLDDPGSMASAAAAADATIHLAFDHQARDLSLAMQKDERVIRAILHAYAGTQKCLVVTTATGMLGNTGPVPVDESFAGEPGFVLERRRAAEALLKEGSRAGVRSVSIRVPVITHGFAAKGLLQRLMLAAQAEGISGFVGTGVNRLPTVHVRDLAQLYVSALGVGSSSIYNAVGAEISMRALAESIGAALGVPVRSILRHRADDLWGAFYTTLLTLDNRPSGARARAELDWAPYTSTPTLVQDILTFAPIESAAASAGMPGGPMRVSGSARLH